jgi:amidase
MGRCVSDAAILLGTMTGVDSKDPVTEESKGKGHSDYTQFLNQDGLKGARIGVVRNLFGFDERVDEIMEDSIEIMRTSRAEIVDPAEIPTAKELWEPEYEVLLYEFKEDLNSYLTGLGPDAPVKSLEEVIKFNEDNSDKTMPFFGQDIMLKSQEKGSLESKEYIEALEKCKKLVRTEGLDPVLKEKNLDAVIAPSGGPAWLTDHVTGDHFSGGSSSLAAVSGYSSITVPAGYIHGLPVGISLISGPYQEPKLIEIAYAFEQASMIRQPPKLKSKVDFT